MTEATMMIEAVLNSLNEIELKGLRNMNILLSCCQTLEAIRSKLEEKEGEKDG